MISSKDILNSFWGSLNQRQQEVVSGRFGLGSDANPQTLAAIGERYGITRERVRQIETAALKIIRQKLMANAQVKDIFEKSKKYLKKSGGVATQEQLLTFQDSLVKDLNANHVALILAAANPFYFRPEDEQFVSFYYLDAAQIKLASAFIKNWADNLEENKNVVLAGGYADTYKKFVKSKNVPVETGDNYLAISKRIARNPYGDVGLSSWPEIRPTTIRDRIYLVLKKKGEPLHFQTIATMINDTGFDDRAALTPTVHNELIKDNRFILVGRGIYGLSEQGFTPGTARDVIHKVLKKHGPLKAKEVIAKVQEERFLKANTVLVNLQNKNHFERRVDGTYRIREA